MCDGSGSAWASLLPVIIAFMSDRSSPRPSERPLRPRCLSIDLEVGLRSGRIRQLAAVRGDSGERLHCRAGDLAGALARLDALAEGCPFAPGHNLLAFDRPHLATVAPSLRLLELPVIDTLWLNPLAFPRHPYHHLVKHYQDGGLRRAQVNDPLLDAQLTLDLFHDQVRALLRQQREEPDLMLAWHWLTTSGHLPAAVDHLFTTLRRRTRPDDVEARAGVWSATEAARSTRCGS